MRRLLPAGLALLCLACSASQPAATQRSPSSVPTTPIASPQVTAQPSATPVPSVACHRGASSPTAMVMLNSAGSTALLYDVSDPLHPALLCTISGTSAHIVTGDTFAYLRPVSPTETDVVLHSIGSGNEGVTARLPLASVYGSWTADGNVMAYTIAQPPSDQAPQGSEQVWLFSGGRDRLVYTYPIGLGDCVCRFGPPPLVLALSPDAQYLVAGWRSGKGAAPLVVLRVFDGAKVATADAAYSLAIWARTGHRLFLSGSGAPGVAVWTPEGGTAVVSQTPWSYFPSLSPDGASAAFTGYADAAFAHPRVYVLDMKSGVARTLVPAERSQALFVKDGWTWYLEERPCGSNEGCAGSTAPSGTVYAMDLATSTERTVSFAPSEDPLNNAGDEGWATFRAGENWPAT